MQDTVTKTNPADEIFLVLSDKEKNIIQKRFALSTNKKTLEEIGQEYQITRERVRQIEKNAINKLRRTSVQTGVSNIFEITVQTLNENGFVMSESQLLKALSRAKETENINADFLTLSFEINPELQKIKKGKNNKKTWFLKDKIDLKLIQKIRSISSNTLKTKKEIISANEFLTEVQRAIKSEMGRNVSKQTIKATLSVCHKVREVEEGFGLTSWRSVMPKSIRDKALIILTRSKKPLHFKEISKIIKESNFDKKSVTVQAVHNELIRYDDFVLIGRGIYALKKWGYKEGTVKDVIKDVLSEKGPLKKTQIVDEVLKRRQVKIGTISLNLQKYPEFKRVGRAVYSLK